MQEIFSSKFNLELEVYKKKILNMNSASFREEYLTLFISIFSFGFLSVGQI